MRKFLVCVLVACSAPMVALAQQQDCSQALITATVNQRYDEVTNLAIAWQMSEQDYNEHKQNVGVTVPIKGVPVSASYGEFRRNISQKAQSYNLTDFEKRAYSYATSGLNGTSLEAYKTCILHQGGLHVFAGNRGKNSVGLWIEYLASADQTEGLRGTLLGSENVLASSRRDLERVIADTTFWRADFEQILIPEDPTKDMTGTIKVGNQSRSFLLAPVPVVQPPREPTFHWKEVRVDDCGAADMTCSLGYRPDDVECRQATLSLTAVCWKANGNYGPQPPHLASCSYKSDWCTYKSTPIDQCHNGKRPGVAYACVKD